jgi:hypothetical protein
VFIKHRTLLHAAIGCFYDHLLLFLNLACSEPLKDGTQLFEEYPRWTSTIKAWVGNNGVQLALGFSGGKLSPTEAKSQLIQ